MVELPPVDTCEIVFVPGRRTPVIVWPSKGQTREQMMQAVLVQFNCKAHRVVYTHGIYKDQLYAIFAKCNAEGNVTFNDNVGA